MKAVPKASPRRSYQPTPREVLSWLPKDATPWQQDSAIQANIKPGEIHWSQRPDTLTLPGFPKGTSYRDIQLPIYYKKSFFEGDSLYHPELPASHTGVAGDPVPYTVMNDNLITSLLLGCIILMLVAISMSGQFIARQAKNFFYPPKNEPTTITETSGEMWFQIFLVVQTCLLLAVIQFFFSLADFGETYSVSHHRLVLIYSGMFVGYFLLKFFLYHVIHWVFFDKRQNEQWMKSFIFMIALEGVCLFPIALLVSYFDLPVKTTLIYTVVVVILFKILSFYKSFIIFFRQNNHFLQNILYFCTLEAIPLFALWGIMALINNYLKINF